MNPVSQPQSPTPLTRDSSPPITTGPVLNEQTKLNDFSNTRRLRRLNSVLLKNESSLPQQQPQTPEIPVV